MGSWRLAAAVAVEVRSSILRRSSGSCFGQVNCTLVRPRMERLVVLVEVREGSKTAVLARIPGDVDPAEVHSDSRL